jgi:hypothetical protein
LRGGVGGRPREVPGQLIDVVPKHHVLEQQRVELLAQELNCLLALSSWKIDVLSLEPVALEIPPEDLQL